MPFVVQSCSFFNIFLYIFFILELYIFMDNGKISRKPVPHNKKKAKWPDHSALFFDYSNAQGA